jgi:Coenzyme PQQ synthesis protein D (PqqD)
LPPTALKTRTPYGIRAVLRTFLAKCRLTPLSRDTFPNMCPAEKPSASYEVSAGIRTTRNEDGGLVLNIKRGKIYRLNGTGALIFEQLTGGQTRSQIIANISREFEIPTEAVEADIVQFLASLQSQGLVREIAEERS